MQAVILAGGAGTRLRPLTLNLPKPMIPIHGKPFMLYIIEELKKFGIKDFVFCVGYLSERVKEFFGNGSTFGVNITYSVEKEFVGTGGALKLAESYLEEEFFVINGDTYLPIDYRSVYMKFKNSGKVGMMVIYDNKENIAQPNIALDDNDYVVCYVKREDLKKGDEKIFATAIEERVCSYIDAGVQIFQKKIVDHISPDCFVSLEVDIFPYLIEKKELVGFVTSQRYYDLGTPERLTLIKEVFK